MQLKTNTGIHRPHMLPMDTPLSVFFASILTLLGLSQRITMTKYVLTVVIAIGLVCSTDRNPAIGQDAFDVNDVSILWPAPKSGADVANLISATETTGGTSLIWPTAAFNAALGAAGNVVVNDPKGTPRSIFLPPELKTPANWKVASIRFDPAAPGTNPAIQKQSPLGVLPQIRLIMQPVVVSGSSARVFDYTAHLVYNLSSPIQNPQGIDPSFSPVVEALKKLKVGLKGQGIETAGHLSVHPGLASAKSRTDFTNQLRGVLKQFLTETKLANVAFMGLADGVEPWIFFPISKDKNGQFIPVGTPEMFSRRNSAPVLPTPQNKTFGTVGVNTSLLFDPTVSISNINANVFPTSPDKALNSMKFSDVADIIANPEVSHFFNTDCVSCHTESTRRNKFNLAPNSGSLAYKRPNGISGPDPALVPKGDPVGTWNVHNFGWFPDTTPMETVTFRTANETADVVDFINRVYLAKAAPNVAVTGQPAATPVQAKNPQVSNALTLIMDIKSNDDAAQLRAFLTASQEKPADQNPITVALNKLGLVHDARFVFLSNDTQLAVITTYDGDFETYIQAFTNELGDIFDFLLSHMKDAPPLKVKDHTAEFLAYVKKRDLQAFGGLYSAYPTLSVQDIKFIQTKATATPAAGN
jgi:hypothetical protein